MDGEKVTDPLPGVKRIVAVASCKGGVGKTTIAVNLAMALRRLGGRIGLFDADLYGPNVPVMLGVRRQEASFPLVGTRGDRSMGFIPIMRSESTPYILPLRRFGLEVMSLGLWYGDRSPITEIEHLGAQMVVQTICDVQWRDLDILVVDLPPGTGQLAATLASRVRVDGVLLVTTPQDMALMDTGRSLRLFQQSGIRVLGYVENMAFLACPHCGRETEVFSMTRRDLREALDLPSLARVPLDPALSRPIDADHPLTQADLESSSASPFRDLAVKVRCLLEDGSTQG